MGWTALILFLRLKMFCKSDSPCIVFTTAEQTRPDQSLQIGFLYNQLLGCAPFLPSTSVSINLLLILAPVRLYLPSCAAVQSPMTTTMTTSPHLSFLYPVETTCVVLTRGSTPWRLRAVLEHPCPALHVSYALKRSSSMIKLTITFA